MCIDVSSFATVWNDINSDGIKTDDESPIRDVCVYARYTDGRDKDTNWYITQCEDHTATHNSGFTNDEGEWLSNFMAGGCGISKDELEISIQKQCDGISISIVVPDGYSPSTPTTTTGCEATFGLVSKP